MWKCLCSLGVSTFLNSLKPLLLNLFLFLFFFLNVDGAFADDCGVSCTKSMVPFINLNFKWFYYFKSVKKHQIISNYQLCQKVQSIVCFQQQDCFLWRLFLSLSLFKMYLSLISLPILIPKDCEKLGGSFMKKNFVWWIQITVLYFL